MIPGMMPKAGRAPAAPAPASDQQAVVVAADGSALPAVETPVPIPAGEESLFSKMMADK